MLLNTAFGVAHADDRSIAEWVIREGGSVVLAGHSQQVRELRELPSSEFQLKTINLVDTNYLAQDVQRIGTLPHLKHLYMSGRTRRPFSLKVKTTKIYEDGEDRDLTDGWVFLRKLPHLETLLISATVFSYPIPITDEAVSFLAEHGTLRELYVSRTGVVGHTLAPLVRLRHLDASYTEFDDESMANLAGMTELRKLNLRDTRISDKGLASIAHLRALTDIDLGGTQVTDAGAGSLSGMREVRRLSLLGTGITDRGLEQLARMDDLEELNVYRTSITNNSVRTLRTFNKLRSLDIRYTDITPAGISILQKTLPDCHIRFLRSAAPARSSEPTLLSELSPKAVAEWVRSMGGKAVVAGARLREISLAGTHVTDGELRNLAQLEHLEKLDLSGTEVSDLGIQHIAAAAKLEELNLADTAVGDTGLAEVARISSLRTLQLDNSFVRGEGLSNLSPLTNLERISLAGLPLDDAHLAFLGAAPGTHKPFACIHQYDRRGEQPPRRPEKPGRP